FTAQDVPGIRPRRRLPTPPGLRPRGPEVPRGVGMRRRPFFIAILGGILAGSLAPLGLAGADGPSAAICSWTGQATFSPGLTFTPQRGTLQFQGQSGSIDCQGTIRGAEVTGPGTLGLQGDYGLGPLSQA